MSPASENRSPSLVYLMEKKEAIFIENEQYAVTMEKGRQGKQKAVQNKLNGDTVYRKEGKVNEKKKEKQLIT